MENYKSMTKRQRAIWTGKLTIMSLSKKNSSAFDNIWKVINFINDYENMMKLCKRCNEVGEFGKTKLSNSGLQIYCKSCMQEITIEWKQRQKGTILKYLKK